MNYLYKREYSLINFLKFCLQNRLDLYKQSSDKKNKKVLGKSFIYK